jgi:hypothetical protein
MQGIFFRKVLKSFVPATGYVPGLVWELATGHASGSPPPRQKVCKVLEGHGLSLDFGCGLGMRLGVPKFFRA